jgi:diguanylate cyclase (GGDEF)-like protein
VTSTLETGVPVAAGIGRPVLVVFDQVSAYQTRVLEGIRAVLTAMRVPLIVYCNDPYAHGLRAPLTRLLSLPDIRGVISTILDDPRSHSDLAAAIAASGLPSVHIGSSEEGPWSVGGDNRSGIRALMGHLLDDLGVRRIALVRGIEFHVDSIEREAQVRAELAARGLTLDEAHVIEGHFAQDPAYDAMQSLLSRSRDFDAVVALNDRSAAGALDALTEAGVRVPEEMVVSGFDDDPIAEDCTPGLTTVSTRWPAQGAEAARLVLTASSGGTPSGHLTMPAALIVRASTQPDDAPRAVDQSGQALRPTDALALMDRALAVNRALMSCRSIEDLLAEMAAYMSRLGLRRCFIVLNDDDPTGPVTTGSVVLSHIDGATTIGTTGEQFDLREILPRPLYQHLSASCLMLQPLSVEGSDLGYVLFEQAAPDRFVWEQLRMDLSRAISTLQETRRHALALERLVAVRTAQLEAEVANRTRAERELRLVNQDLMRLTSLDGLTNIANRSAFDRYLGEQWEAHVADGQPISVLLVDVDHFKELNDGFGHLCGDRSLQVLARGLREVLWSPEDLAARYGGDEFAAILPRTDAYGAAAVAHRLRQAVESGSLTDGHRFTVSIGAATVFADAGSTPTGLVSLADSALYEAKQQGRDRVVSRTDATSPDGNPERPRPSATR